MPVTLRDYQQDVVDKVYKNKNDYSIYGDLYNRDLTINAIAYDNGFIDPLGGILDIKNKTLSTVCEPDRVFSFDGLRLMRLARFAGELNFQPTYEVIQSAKKYAGNILDISPVATPRALSVSGVLK